jgi:class 3 adenylate cyclase
VSEYLDDFIAAGLYDPTIDSEAFLELLLFLADDVGASIPEIVQAREQDGLLSFAAYRRLREGREVMTLADAAAAAGVDRTVALAVWRAAGLPEPRPFEKRCGPDDVEMFQLFADMTLLVAPEPVLQLARTIGESIGRIAEAEVAMLRSNIEAPLQESAQYVEVARSYIDAAEALLPRITAVMETLHRHHIQAIGRRYSEVGAPTSALNVVQLAVGFADLAGYTGLSSRLDPVDFADMLGRFEGTTGDVITACGATVAKRIGDAVMFVANAPGVACTLVLDLLDACARARLPKMRVGLAFGDVMVRQGDFYGPTVNLAARLVASAEPGTALADEELHSRLGRVRMGYAFVPAGRLELAGFPEAMMAYQVLRS